MKVHIVAAELHTEKILPRLAKLLAAETGWSLSGTPNRSADINYAFPYLELRHNHTLRMAGFFTHREDNVPLKVNIWNRQAERCVLRMVLGPLYEADLAAHGLTRRAMPPLDRNFFSPSLVVKPVDAKPTVGVSGYVYGGGRKGEQLVADAARSAEGQQYEWVAIGRGWPVPTSTIRYKQLAAWYNGLDVYFCPSLIEGVPYGPLEALACGVPIVIPRGVGLLDELPDIPGIVRYDRGDAESAAKAFEELHETFGAVCPDDLRAATERYTTEAWVQSHVEAFAELEAMESVAAHPRVASVPADTELTTDMLAQQETQEAMARGASARRAARGIYIVAYGEPARRCAERLIASIRVHMPTIPVAVASDTLLPEADINIPHPDADLGGRTVKVKMFDLAPQEWEEILYLDADTELTADISFLFGALEDGWEVVCTKDQDDYDLIYSLWRRDNQEHALGKKALGSSRALQLAGGVMAFRRTPATALFFKTWYAEWFRMARRDQGALIRSMYKHPVKLLVLGNEWNSFTGIFTGTTAGVLHHRGGPARRWRSWKGGRLDDPAFKDAIMGEQGLEPTGYWPGARRRGDYWGPRPPRR